MQTQTRNIWRSRALFARSRRLFCDVPAFAARVKDLEQTYEDTFTKTRLEQFDCSLPTFARSTPREAGYLPAGYHLALFPPISDEANLGLDGSEQKDEFIPAPGYERMWAGGSITWHRNNPALQDENLVQTLSVDDVQVKKSKLTGTQNIFVWQKADIANMDGTCLVDRVCRLFREPGASAKQMEAAASLPDHVEALPSFDFQETFTPSIITLFRFSALTFNPHKIHYDPVYVKQVENRPGLVVHGPLQALLLVRLFVNRIASKPNGGTIKSFEYRATNAAYVDRPLTLAGKWNGKNACDLYVVDDTGLVTMKGTATRA